MLVQKQIGKEPQSSIIQGKKHWNIPQSDEVQGSEKDYPGSSLNRWAYNNYVNFGDRSPIFFSGLPIQTKLIVGQPKDKYEQEADKMAERVTCLHSNAHASNSPCMIGKSLNDKKDENWHEGNTLMRFSEEIGGFV